MPGQEHLQGSALIAVRGMPTDLSRLFPGQVGVLLLRYFRPLL